MKNSDRKFRPLKRSKEWPTGENGMGKGVSVKDRGCYNDKMHKESVGKFPADCDLQKAGTGSFFAGVL